MRQQQLAAAMIERAIVAGEFLDRDHMCAGAFPLLDESSAMLRERRSERLIHRGGCAMQRTPESERERKRLRAREIDLANQCDVTVVGGGELIIEFEVAA